MEIIFVTPETIIQPKNTVPFVNVPNEGDHVLGSTTTPGTAWDEVSHDGHWKDTVIKVEIQRNVFGDTFWCVTFSCNNCHEILHKKQYGVEINKSDRFLAIGSGTVRNQGNSKWTVAEWNRLNGFRFEIDCPYLESMSLDDAYAPLDPKLFGPAKNMLKVYYFGYKWLKDGLPSTILAGLKFSPVQVDVEHYIFNANGYIINSGMGYTHEVIIIDYEPGVCWWIMDSENKQFIKFDWNYNFGSPMIHAMKRLSMPKIYKAQGSPALYFKHWNQDVLYAVADGALVGGDLFKTLLGTDDYESIPRVKQPDGLDWVTLPFPVSQFSFKVI